MHDDIDNFDPTLTSGGGDGPEEFVDESDVVQAPLPELPEDDD